jgi:hypothetical protein
MDEAARKRLSVSLSQTICEVLDSFVNDKEDITHFLTSLRTLLMGYAEDSTTSVVMLVQHADEALLHVHAINTEPIQAHNMIDLALKVSTARVTADAPPLKDRH